jgi:glycosyltransferase involved in cell wall biosynthesis
LKVLLVDPSLFTAPYDAALSKGLLSAGIEPIWAVRPLREGEQEEIADGLTEPVFYRHVDGMSAVPASIRSALKGIAHLRGLYRLVLRAGARDIHVVHFQWNVLPLADSVAMRWLKRMGKTVVVTVHDTVPFNGDRLTLLQTLGFDLPAKTAHRVIVHTHAAAETLAARGIERSKISVVPHGCLSLTGAARAVGKPRDERWTFVMFGQIKPYKGLDVLIDAARELPPSILAQARFIVAGLPRMAMTQLQERIVGSNLGRSFDLRLHRLDEPEIAELLDSADTFVFPYRHVDASGVFYLVRGWNKWIIASSVGVFAEELTGSDGAQLVKAGDVSQLSAALAAAIATRPPGRPQGKAVSWREIGALTRQAYGEAHARSGPSAGTGAVRHAP